MPRTPPTRCAEPGCSEIVPRGRCEEHQRPSWNGRDDKAARYDGISSGEWRALKRRVAYRDNGCCYRCGADQDRREPDEQPFVLDHIVPMSEGGSARDLDNLGLLCGPCDEVKSKAEAARGNARRNRARARP